VKNEYEKGTFDHSFFLKKKKLDLQKIENHENCFLQQHDMMMYIKIDLFKKNSPSYEQFIIQYQLLILN
jgi:hypothetical protein